MKSHLLLFMLAFLSSLVLFIRRAEVCQCVCRKSFMTYEFPTVKHVVMDEVQNFRIEDGDWLQRARELVRSPQASDDPDENPGFLWLFIDNGQINHSFATGIPNEKKQVVKLFSS